MPILTQVILQKLEKTPDGAATDRIVPGAEFYLYKVGDPDDVQIGGRYVTDQNGQIRLQGLTNGQYFFLETRPGYGFTFDQDEKGDPITRYDFTVTGLEVNNRLTVTAYNRRQLGPLTIGKLVENADGSPLTDAQKALEFAFTVSFSDGGTYAYRIDGGELQTVGDGGIIKLKHGQNAVFENIPVGVEYKVEEAVFPGYTVRSENHQGEIVAAMSCLPIPAHSLPSARPAWSLRSRSTARSQRAKRAARSSLCWRWKAWSRKALLCRRGNP